MGDFFNQFAGTQSQLADLLDTNFIPGEKDQITDYIYDVQKKILELQNAGAYARRNYHLLRLMMFLKHLKELKNERKDLFSSFKRELKEEDYDHYFGTRFEIDIAASLVRKGIEFEHPDPPDFTISNKEIAIECGIGHFSGRDRTIREKIEQTVDNKSDKPYYNSNNVLFIDLTNIFYHSTNRDTEFSNEKLKEWINIHLETFNLDIGSVILFTYVADASEDGSGMHHSYLRVDNNAEDELIRFLEEYWPVGDFNISKTFYPNEP